MDILTAYNSLVKARHQLILAKNQERPDRALIDSADELLLIAQDELARGLPRPGEQVPTPEQVKGGKDG